MPICHDKKFIFCHIQKTGGSSICKALEEAGCELDYHHSRNKKPGRMTRHMALSQIRNQYPGYDNYRVYSFVRNPYDRAISYYFFKKQGKSSATYVKKYKNIVDWLTHYGESEKIARRKGKPPFLCQSEYLNDRIDFIGRFENLYSDYGRMCAELGISNCLNRHHVHKSKHKEYADYKNALPLVAKIFEVDFERFSYCK